MEGEEGEGGERGEGGGCLYGEGRWGSGVWLDRSVHEIRNKHAVREVSLLTS